MLYSVIYQNLIIIFYNIRLIFLFLLYKAYDGSLSNDRLLDVLCGVTIAELLSISNVMYVRLYMKTSGVNRGFLITYSQGMYKVMELSFLYSIIRQIHAKIEKKVNC